MKITVTYEVDDDMMEMIEDILENYEPSDFENEDDKEIFLDDIAMSLMDEYHLSLRESIAHMLEEHLKKKGWIK